MLPYAHYTDDRFKEAQVVFGSKQSGLTWDYSDRLQQWNYEKYGQACDAAKELGAKPRTARWALIMLRYYFDDQDLELACIMTGFNLSNGYDYYVYGYCRSKAQ